MKRRREKCKTKVERKQELNNLDETSKCTLRINNNKTEK